MTDFAYVGRDTTVTLAAGIGAGEVALASGACEQRLPPRYGPAEDVAIEIRGAGPSTRQVTNFLSPEAWAHADKLMASSCSRPTATGRRIRRTSTTTRRSAR